MRWGFLAAWKHWIWYILSGYAFTFSIFFTNLVCSSVSTNPKLMGSNTHRFLTILTFLRNAFYGQISCTSTILKQWLYSECVCTFIQNDINTLKEVEWSANQSSCKLLLDPCFHVEIQFCGFCFNHRHI